MTPSQQSPGSPPEHGHHNLGGLTDKQLRLIVFAALAAFLVMAAYEFYLAVEMTHDLQEMTLQVQRMSPNIQRNMDSMAQNMRQMNQSTDYMARATGQMQADFWSLNRNISPPFSLLGGWIPWPQHSNPYAGPSRPLPLPQEPAYPQGYAPAYPYGYGAQGNAGNE